MQDVDVDNGCMWYVQGSHKKELRKHRKVAEGHHANYCDCSEVFSMSCDMSTTAFIVTINQKDIVDSEIVIVFLDLFCESSWIMSKLVCVSVHYRQ